MKTFIIFFTGHCPVGAVGIAKGVDLDDAVTKFHNLLQEREPFLCKAVPFSPTEKENSFANLHGNAYEFTDEATILLNGEY